jgi:Mg2+ and Co2+ transporter CorA
MANFPDTKVSLIEIMRAFHRWNPNDIRDLFVDEIKSMIEEKNVNQFNRNIFDDEKDVRISSLEKLLQEKINGHEFFVKHAKEMFDSLETNNKYTLSKKDKEVMDLKLKIQDLDKVIKHFSKLCEELNSEKFDLQLKYNRLLYDYNEIETEFRRLYSTQNSSINCYQNQ